TKGSPRNPGRFKDDDFNSVRSVLDVNRRMARAGLEGR
ncbi:hypothetical protein PSYMO_37297, partial [Pseudomonas amygdali pv. mori str. 301020]